MSYRTRINDFQIFENNGYSKELISELKRQGANIKENDDSYKFEIKDINPIIKIIDEYFQNKLNETIQENINPYDLTFHWTMVKKDKPLYDRIDNCIYTNYLFQSYNFMQYLYNNKLVKRNNDGSHTILKKIVISGG